MVCSYTMPCYFFGPLEKSIQPLSFGQLWNRLLDLMAIKQRQYVKLYFFVLADKYENSFSELYVDLKELLVFSFYSNSCVGDKKLSISMARRPRHGNRASSWSQYSLADWAKLLKLPEKLNDIWNEDFSNWSKEHHHPFRLSVRNSQILNKLISSEKSLEAWFDREWHPVWMMQAPLRSVNSRTHHQPGMTENSACIVKSLSQMPVLEFLGNLPPTNPVFICGSAKIVSDKWWVHVNLVPDLTQKRQMFFFSLFSDDWNIRTDVQTEICD